MKGAFPKQMKLSEQYAQYALINERHESANFALHWHDYYEIEICEEGQATHYINGKKFSFERGDFLIIRATDFHEVKIEKPLKYFNLSFSPTSIEPKLLTILLQKRSFICGKLNKTDFEYLTNILRVKERSKTDALGDIIYFSVLNTAIATLLRYAPTLDGDDERTDLQNAINFIHTSFAQNPSLTTVATMSGYQVNYFCRKFRSLTGKTYSQYLSELKINHAKNLLASTTLPVTDICFECGFSSLANFLREFKKKNKITPTQFRKLQKRVKGENENV